MRNLNRITIVTAIIWLISVIVLGLFTSNICIKAQPA